MKPILILAMGNPSRGDDAFGPLLAERLSHWLSLQPLATQDQIDVISDQQLMVEHVDDLQGRQHVLFIDAAATDTQAIRLTPMAPLPQAPAVQSHSCTPPQLLALYRHLLNMPPPPSDLLTAVGQGFELGTPLSRATQENMDAAWSMLLTWLSKAQECPHA